MGLLSLSARSFFRDPSGYVERHANGDGVVRLAAGLERFVVVRDPDSVWQVLVTDSASFPVGKWKRRARRFVGPTLNTLDGAEHSSRRRLVQPSVARGRVAGFVPAMVARAERAQAGWRHGASIDLRAQLDPLCLAMAGDVLLSVDLEPKARELAMALRTVMRRVPRFTPPVAGTRQARALAHVQGVLDELAVTRARTGAPGEDLLGALLAGDLPESTVRGELLAFLMAAVDEPPSALEAAWYLLARNPESEQRLHAELDAVLGTRLPGEADAERLPFLDAVVRETLRLFPPARHIDRCPVRDVEIGAQRVTAGTNVVVSPFVTHREPGLYPGPGEFAPERWLDTSTRARRGAYLPFGAGPHTCVGESLARAIVTFTFATIGRRWRMVLPAQAPPPVPGSPPLMARLSRR